MVRGSDVVEDADLSILQHCVTPDQEEQVKVRRIITEYAGATEKAIAEYTNALAEIEQEVAAVSGASDDDKGNIAGRLNFKVKKIVKLIEQEIEAANRENQPTAKLDALKDRAVTIRKHITTDILG